MNKGSLTSSVAMLILLFSIACHAKTFYVDPSGGLITNDGSEEHPWSTLQEVFEKKLISSKMFETKPAVTGGALTVKNPDAPVKPGDTLLCKNGYHGTVSAIEYYNDDWITLRAFPAHSPRIAAIEIRSACRFRLVGFTISPSFAPQFKRSTIINFSSHNWTGPIRECIAEACTCYTVPDASGWTKEQWDTLSCNGISLSGPSCTARGNVFKNVNFGISVTGDSCLADGNSVTGFAGDGMRGLGDYDVFQYNTIKNCYAVNANHDDGFQSWSLDDSGNPGGGVVYGIILRGNTIINYEDPDQPFRGTLQGIGCFDGMFSGWLVENNVVITDHWHGITLSGAENCVIVNNTVVDINEESPGPPWIRISGHKNGTPSSGCIVRNNLTTDLSCSDTGVTADHNIIVKTYDDYFVNYAGKDLHLRAECDAIDAGSDEFAVLNDHDRLGRPAGSSVDVGAYEYGAQGVKRERVLPGGGYGFSCVSKGHLLLVTLPSAGGVLTLFDGMGRVMKNVDCGGRSSLYVSLPQQSASMLLLRYKNGVSVYYRRMVFM